ncbi:hypothetical protein M3Y94_01301700 [Aphelenchoides besseyi]|nr:hypothetical protein M3Y94_01301700 [Aphelenchoides besseyi]
MTDEKFVVKVEDMRRFVVDCMAAVGAKEENGKKVADLLIAADQRGHYSHGLNRLRIYMEDCRSGNCDPNAQPTILRQKGATAWIDGNNGLGAVVGDYCTRIAIELAQQNGVGWVVAKGSNHFGIAGYWPILMKERGYLGIAMTNTSPSFSARCGNQSDCYCCTSERKRRLCSRYGNVCYRGHYSKRVDFSSAVALGKIELAERKGEKINEQWGADSKGRNTDDPTEITQQGGYKGFGLGMSIEVLSSILAGATYGKKYPLCFAPNFNSRLQSYLDETRRLIPIDRTKKVLIPGDPEREHLAESGIGIVYGQAQLDHLLDIAKQNNVNAFNYRNNNAK